MRVSQKWNILILHAAPGDESKINRLNVFQTRNAAEVIKEEEETNLFF